MVIAEQGLLNHVRVELRNGELTEMSPQRPPHATNKVHLEPSNGDYNRRVTYRHDEAFAPSAFPEDKHIWLPDPL